MLERRVGKFSILSRNKYPNTIHLFGHFQFAIRHVAQIFILQLIHTTLCTQNAEKSLSIVHSVDMYVYSESIEKISRVYESIIYKRRVPSAIILLLENDKKKEQFNIHKEVRLGQFILSAARERVRQIGRARIV